MFHFLKSTAKSWLFHATLLVYMGAVVRNPGAQLWCEHILCLHRSWWILWGHLSTTWMTLGCLVLFAAVAAEEWFLFDRCIS